MLEVRPKKENLKHSTSRCITQIRFVYKYIVVYRGVLLGWLPGNHGFLLIPGLMRHVANFQHPGAKESVSTALQKSWVPGAPHLS